MKARYACCISTRINTQQTNAINELRLTSLQNAHETPKQIPTRSQSVERDFGTATTRTRWLHRQDVSIASGGHSGHGEVDGREVLDEQRLVADTAVLARRAVRRHPVIAVTIANLLADKMPENSHSDVAPTPMQCRITTAGTKSLLLEGHLARGGLCAHFYANICYDTARTTSLPICSRRIP